MIQLAFVIDCSKCMLHYVDHFKKEALKVIQAQDIKMEIAFVIYRAKDNQKKAVITASATNIRTYPFKPSGTYKSDIIPSQEAILEKTSLHPINVHRALFDALEFDWSSAANQRILILIGKNPPHGKQYHELGPADLYEEGIHYPNNQDILSAIGKKQIHLFVINIDNALTLFCQHLMNTEDQGAIVRKWVRCFLVENMNSLTHKLLDCITGCQDSPHTHTQSNKKKPQALTSNGIHKYDYDDVVGKLRWIKEREERYPVLVESVHNTTAFVWDGASTTKVALTNLYRGSHLMNEVHSVRKSNNAVHLLLVRSRAKQQTLMVGIKGMIEGGTTQCSFKDSGKIQIGTILGVKGISKCRNYTQYRVQRHDTREAILLWDDQFQILGSYHKTSELKELQTQNDELKSQNGTLSSHIDHLQAEMEKYKATADSFQSEKAHLQSNNEQKTAQLKQLQTINDELKSQNGSLISQNEQLTSDIGSLRAQIEEYKSKTDSLQSDKAHLQSENARLRTDSDHEKSRKTEKIKQLKDCQKVPTIANGYHHLRQESYELKKLVAQLRVEQIKDSPALDVASGFPPLQDIVNDFGTLKSHYHVEARKQLKVLKQKNKEHSKLRKYKFVCQILFDILMKSYGAIKQFKDEQYRDFALSNELDIHNGKHRKRVERKVKEKYSVLIEKSKKDKARSIVSDVKASYGMNDYLKDDTKLLEYTEQCIAICWVITLARNPMLSIEPQQFDQSILDNYKETCFDEQLHIEGFGSEDNEPLNFVVWPSLVRQDTQCNISKITGVFVKEIPQWNKKRMKRMNAEKKEQIGDSKEDIFVDNQTVKKDKVETEDEGKVPEQQSLNEESGNKDDTWHVD